MLRRACVGSRHVLIAARGASFEDSAAKGLFLYNIKCKFHYLDHILYDLPYTPNPAKTACIIDEDFIGCMKNLASRCHEKTVSERFLMRQLLHLAVRFERRRRMGTLSIAR